MHIVSVIDSAILYVLIGMFGACLGSYAALVIKRMPAGISTVSPRSRCDICSTTLRVWHNIPIFSWIFLRGKCFFCKSSIGLRSLFIEVFFAVTLMAIFSRYGLSILTVEKCIFVFLLVCMSYIDLDTFYLPNILLIFLIILGLCSSAFFYFNPSEYGALSEGASVLRYLILPIPSGFSWSNRLFGAMAGFLSLFGINLMVTAMLRKSGRLNKNQWAMGIGDPVLVMGIGLFVGLSHLVLTIFIASFLGSIFGIIQKVFKSGLLPESDVSDGAIPFGPFLSLAAIYVYLF